MPWPLWLKVALGAGGLLLLGGAGGLPASTAVGNVYNLGNDFWQALWQVAQNLGSTPYVLGLLLFEESGINPGAKNADGCVGINQFCDGTYEYFVSMSKDQYLALSATEQLQYVAKYWASKPRGGLASTRDIFWLSLTPVTWVPNASPDTVVNDPAKLGASYAATVATYNPTIAVDGVITAGSIDAYLASVAASPGWQYAMTQIAANSPSGNTPVETA